MFGVSIAVVGQLIGEECMMASQVILEDLCRTVDRLKMTPDAQELTSCQVSSIHHRSDDGDVLQ